MGGLEFAIEAADHLVVKMLAVGHGRGLPLLDVARGAVGLRPQFGPHVFRFAQQPLRVVANLVELAAQAGLRIELLVHVRGRRRQRRQFAIRAGQRHEQLFQRGRAAGGPLAAAAGDQRDRAAARQAGRQLFGPLDLGLHAGQRGRRQAARRGRTVAAFARFRRAIDLRPAAGFDDQRPRSHQAGQLGIAKCVEQPEHVAIDRLLPEILSRIEVAAHQRGVDPRVERRPRKGPPVRLRRSRPLRSPGGWRCPRGRGGWQGNRPRPTLFAPRSR